MDIDTIETQAAATYQQKQIQKRPIEPKMKITTKQATKSYCKILDHFP